MLVDILFFFFFFFNDTATTEIYTLSLHDALPIWRPALRRISDRDRWPMITAPIADGRKKKRMPQMRLAMADRKSTRLNSSHSQISYAVFCLKKKKQQLQRADCCRTHRLSSH